MLRAKRLVLDTLQLPCTWQSTEFLEGMSGQVSGGQQQSDCPHNYGVTRHMHTAPAAQGKWASVAGGSFLFLSLLLCVDVRLGYGMVLHAWSMRAVRCPARS
jgi:hypothetical protein